MRPLANDASGAGPIAAPTAVPSASIAAASMVVVRSDGSRGTPGGVAGGVGLSGLVVTELGRSSSS